LEEEKTDRSAGLTPNVDSRSFAPLRRRFPNLISSFQVGQVDIEVFESYPRDIRVCKSASEKINVIAGQIRRDRIEMQPVVVADHLGNRRIVIKNARQGSRG